MFDGLDVQVPHHSLLTSLLMSHEHCHQPPKKSLALSTSMLLSKMIRCYLQYNPQHMILYTWCKLLAATCEMLLNYAQMHNCTMCTAHASSPSLPIAIWAPITCSWLLRAHLTLTPLSSSSHHGYPLSNHPQIRVRPQLDIMMIVSEYVGKQWMRRRRWLRVDRLRQECYQRLLSGVGSPSIR